MTKSAIVTYGRQNFFSVPVPPPAWTPHCASKVEVLEPPPSRNVVADQWTEVQADRQAGGANGAHILTYSTSSPVQLTQLTRAWRGRTPRSAGPSS